MKKERGSKYAELKEKYQLLTDLMNQVPDVIYFKDTKGRLIMVNKAHAKGLGLSPEQVAGKTDFDIFPKKRAEKMFKDDQSVLRTGKPIIDKIERATRADGVDNYVSTTKIPRYDQNGKIIGLIGITRDITSRMQFEHIKEENTKIEQKLAALEASNKVKSEFVSIVSHELRTPLAIIKEAVSLLYDEAAGALNEKQKKLLSSAQQNTERLRRIIEDLLDISRIEKGTLKLHYSLVNLNNLIRDSAEFFKKQAAQKNIELKYNLPDEEINIFIDAEKIIQVVSNLINNALKFTEEGGRINVEVKSLENKIRVGVSDSGIGIAKEDVAKLFNRFVQVSKIPGAERKGLGLGLSIAKELIRKHAGEIWCESKLGVGTKFYFTLPGFFTMQALARDIQDKINAFLRKDITVYLINLSIINLREFKARIKAASKEVFDNIGSTIKRIIEAMPAQEGKPQLLLRDEKNGIFSVLYPEATEHKAAKLCAVIKAEIEKYFAAGRIRDVFINVGIISYPLKEKGANLYIKKIHIGPELRRFKRIDYNADIELALAGGKTEACRGIDISKGGVCFLCAAMPKTDSAVRVKLPIPGTEKTANFQGRVAWLKLQDEEANSGNFKYKVGVEFAKMGKSEKRQLTELIQSIIKTPK